MNNIDDIIWGRSKEEEIIFEICDENNRLKIIHNNMWEVS